LTWDEALEAALNRAWFHVATTRKGDQAVGGGDTEDITAALRGIEVDRAAAVLQGWLAELARKTDRVSVVATGLSWIGGGTRSVEQTLLALVAEAKEEILVTAYSVTGGSGRVMDRLRRAVSAGVRCVFIVNRLGDQRADMRSSLEDLALHYPGVVAIYDFEDESTEGLHAKVVVVDRRAAVVGSANLTFHGLTSSHELGLLVRGPAAAAVASAIDQLTSSPQVRRVS
jgi:phosphatidylserine/phosphatidylglycerophosphate/cardiolipin synthase-like enzyme